jgi:hypothetical protein
MQSLRDRDWVALDGRLEAIDFAGFADDRSPPELAELALKAYSKPGDWVLDPFAGLGTTLFAAGRLGRHGIGFEPNPDRHAWVSSRLTGPSRIIPAPIQTFGAHDLPPFQLVFTSPPYPAVRLEDDPWGPSYFEDMAAIFATIARAMAPDGHMVVEVSNILTEDGYRPLVGQMAEALGKVLRLEREIARVNTSDWPAGPGVGHSALLIFRPPA